MSVEEVELFVEMEERELMSYGVIDVEECNVNYRKINIGCQVVYNGRYMKDYLIEEYWC